MMRLSELTNFVRNAIHHDLDRVRQTFKTGEINIYFDQFAVI